MALKTLVAASARPIILALLLSGESYGYQILNRVRKVSGGTLQWSSALLYPVLHRLEKDGLIRSEWKLSEKGRMRKYYLLTKKGRQEFLKEKEHWLNIQEAFRKLLSAAEGQD